LYFTNFPYCILYSFPLFPTFLVLVLGFELSASS
jgi:hypothetical protein